MNEDTIITREMLEAATPVYGAHPQAGSYVDGKSGLECRVCAMEWAHLCRLLDEGKTVRLTDDVTDKDPTVCPVIGAFVRAWNDAMTDADRARWLTPAVMRALPRTKTSTEDTGRRAWMATDWLVRHHLAAWVDFAGLADHSEALRDLPELVDSASAASAQPTIDAARAAWDAARAAALDAARAAGDAAWDAARDAARAAALDAARAAALDAARDAARAAALDAARAAAWDKLRPTVEALQASAADLLARMCAVGR